jgi:hypothetical protein
VDGKTTEENISSQFSELKSKYPSLSLLKSASGELLIKGILVFSASYDEISIEDEYEIEITIPRDYPDALPVAKEIGGRIPGDFHHNPDGTLCLSAPLEVKKKFSHRAFLLGFVEDLLIPFLYSYSFKVKYERMPFGELPHGIEGILKDYKDKFNVNNNYAVFGLLKILADDDYRGHALCPCGSNIKLRNCHGKLLMELKKYQKTDEFFREYLLIFNHMMKSGEKEMPKEFIIKLERLKKKIKNISSDKTTFS